jgi:hypothetical protein
MSTRNLKHEAQLAEGNFVKVAGAGNQAEAEFLQGLLREQGVVPSSLRRARGFDVPDFLAAGIARRARRAIRSGGGRLAAPGACGRCHRLGARGAPRLARHRVRHIGAGVALGTPRLIEPREMPCNLRSSQ